MRHVEIALSGMPEETKQFIQLSNISEEKGTTPIVAFTIQSDPVREVGVNGCQAKDMLNFTLRLFESLYAKSPDKFTARTIQAMTEAVYWQQERDADREHRGVEGTKEP